MQFAVQFWDDILHAPIACVKHTCAITDVSALVFHRTAPVWCLPTVCRAVFVVICSHDPEARVNIFTLLQMLARLLSSLYSAKVVVASSLPCIFVCEFSRAPAACVKTTCAS